MTQPARSPGTTTQSFAHAPSRPPPLAAPAVQLPSIAPASACSGEAEDERAAEHDREPAREAQRADQPEHDERVEEEARVAGLAQHLEQHADPDRADDDARPGCPRRRG